MLVFNNTKVIPAALTGVRLGRGETTPRIEVLLHMRLDGARWKAFAKPGKKLQAGDRLRFGAEGRVCLLGEVDATVEAKGEAGEITLAFDFSGPVLDEAIAAVGRMPLAALYRRQAGNRRPGCHGLPDHICRTGRGGGRTHGWPALHAGPHEKAGSCWNYE